MPVLEGLDGLAEEVRGRSFLSLRPELTLRSVQRRDESGVTTRRRRNLLGAEIKWRPNADWVIDATLNPDFSQVEIDAPQLSGNTRFALSLPEKRPFFLESAELVGQTLPDETGENRTLPAFYTRAITDPDAGLRASWRGEGAEATLLSLRDAGGGLVLRPGALVRPATRSRASRSPALDARSSNGATSAWRHSLHCATGGTADAPTCLAATLSGAPPRPRSGAATCWPRARPWALMPKASRSASTRSQAIAAGWAGATRTPTGSPT